MAGYSFLLDKSVKDNPSIQNYLQNWVRERALPASFYTIEKSSDIAQVIATSKQAHSFIAVGMYRCWQSMLAQAAALDESVTLGYIPIQEDAFAKKIGVKDYKSGCQAIEQRKVVSVNVASVNSQYMLYDYDFNISTLEGQKTLPITINIDKLAHFQLPASEVIIRNEHFLSQEDTITLHLEAFSNKVLSQDTRSAVKNTKNSLRLSSDKRSIFRINAQQIEISAPGQKLSSRTSSSLRSPLKVGFLTKKIRLIVAKSRPIDTNNPFST